MISTKQPESAALPRPHLQSGSRQETGLQLQSGLQSGPQSGPRAGQLLAEGVQWLNPVQYSPLTLRELAAAPATLQAVLTTLERLDSDDYLEFMKRWYRQGLRSFGSAWQYLDLLTVLQATCQAIQPRNFLEIGVRRGRSMAIVAAAVPDCELTGFDLWMADYAGMSNPGPQFVQLEMTKAGHVGPLQLFSGDSHETVPAFFARHPDCSFDLINVDGDHSEAGARKDLENVIPRLNVGGVLVMDDIAHPQHRYLERAWDELLGADDRFATAKYGDLGYGVAFAVRRS